MKPQKIFYFLLFIVLLSCSQDTPKIEDSFQRSALEQQRLNACTEVDLVNNILEHKNTQSLFRCFAWDQQFPSLFEAVTKIDTNGWNHVVGPIDKAFLNDLTRRDRVLEHVEELEAKNGLDDLSFVLQALTEINFADGLKNIFNCADKISGDDCTEQVIASKDDIKNLLGLVKTNPTYVNILGDLLKSLIVSLEEDSVKFKADTFRLSQRPDFKVSRSKLVEAIANKVLSSEGITERDHKLITDLLFTKNPKTGKSWVYTWLTDEGMNEAIFSKIVRFPVDKSPFLIRDLKAMEVAFSDTLECKPDEKNNILEKKLFSELSEVFQSLTSSDIHEFFRVSLKNANLLKAAQTFCPDLESYRPYIEYIDIENGGDLVRKRHRVDFHIVLNNLSEFFQIPKAYEIAQFLFHLTNAKEEAAALPGDLDIRLRDKMYLLSLIMGDMAIYGNELNKIIGINTDGYDKVLYRVLVKMGEKSFFQISELVDVALKDENRETLKSVSRIWLSLKPEEREYLFSFIDRHFSENVDYLTLFDFYNKAIEELPDLLPSLAAAWVGTADREEITYQALGNLTRNMAGVGVLNDLKKFLSRDHLVRILEILAKGEQFHAQALQEYNYVINSNLINRLNEREYVFEWDVERSKSGLEIANCLNDMTTAGGTFYVVANRLPESCHDLGGDEISLQIYQWMSNINKDYTNLLISSDIKENQPQSGLFSDMGVASPALLENGIVTTLLLNEIFDQDGESDNVRGVERFDGLSYLADSAHHHLYVLEHQVDGQNVSGFKKSIDNVIKVTGGILGTRLEESRLFRSSLIKKYSKEENFSLTTEVVSNGLDFFEAYLRWFFTGQQDIAEKRNLGTYDDRYSCKNFLNQNVESFEHDHTCPSVDVIKKQGTKILKDQYFLHSTRFGSALARMIKAFIPEEGVLIPLPGDEDDKPRKRYHLTLETLVTFLYDLSAPDLEINRLEIPFVTQEGTESLQTLSTMQRIDVTIRESSIKNNYLGVQYMNDVAHTGEYRYNNSVISKRRLIKTCRNIPIFRCGRSMPKSDKRLVSNIIATYDALLDVNSATLIPTHPKYEEYNKGIKNEHLRDVLEPRFEYGDFMKAFVGIFVGSSAKRAQKKSFLPLKDASLVRHNGQILVEMARLTATANLGRYIHDRIGRTREEFQSFIESEPFQRVNRSFMRGFPLEESQYVMEDLLRKVTTPDDQGQTLFDYSVDWINTLSYEDLRLVEDTLARSLWLGSYLGAPDVVFSEVRNPYHRYSKNNVFSLVKAANTMIDVWPIFRKVFLVEDHDLIPLIRKVNNLLYFITEHIEKESDPKKNVLYKTLNDSFVLLDNIFFKEQKDARVANNEGLSHTGLDFVTSYASNERNVSNLYQITEDLYGYFDRLHYSDAEKTKRDHHFFANFVTKSREILADVRFNGEPIRNYLSLTSKNALCYGEGRVCESNYHYDEPANLARYLAVEDKDSGQSNFMNLIETVLVNDRKRLLDFYTEISDYLNLKKR